MGDAESCRIWFTGFLSKNMKFSFPECCRKISAFPESCRMPFPGFLSKNIPTMESCRIENHQIPDFYRIWKWEVLTRLNHFSDLQPVHNIFEHCYSCCNCYSCCCYSCCSYISYCCCYYGCLTAATTATWLQLLQIQIAFIVAIATYGAVVVPADATAPAAKLLQLLLQSHCCCCCYSRYCCCSHSHRWYFFLLDKR